MTNNQIDTIEVTVDKSHIVTMGERLYGESIELIRELINNAYDADATEVRVTIKDDGPEYLTEGTVIYINRDHPLYKKEAQKKDAYELYIARLLTQEVCLMKDPRNPRQAFQRQSRLCEMPL